jgi:hypothetical protein
LIESGGLVLSRVSHGGKHFLGGGQRFALLGNHLSIYRDSELATIPVYQMHLNARLFR